MSTNATVTQEKTLSTVFFNRQDINPASIIKSAEMNATHRCDRCNAQAFVRAVNESNFELTLCGNHARHAVDSLIAQGFRIDDQTHRINYKPTDPANN